MWNHNSNQGDGHFRLLTYTEKIKQENLEEKAREFNMLSWIVVIFLIKGSIVVVIIHNFNQISLIL